MGVVVLASAQPGRAPVAALAEALPDATVRPLTAAAVDLRADAFVIDARTDLAAARRILPLLAAPALLIVATAAWPHVDPAWGFADVIDETAGAAELAARVRRIAAPAPGPLAADAVVIDEDAYRASVAGQPLDLTYTEFELLKYLVGHPGRVHTRDHLLAEVWGYDYFGGTRTVDVHVRRLRAKLGPEHDALIETVRNVGYRFSPR